VSTIQLPPLVIIGAEGAGKHTVGTMLSELAGYKECPRSGKGGKESQPFRRAYVISNDRGMVRLCMARGFRSVYVYATPTQRADRLVAGGRMQLGDELSDDHGPLTAEYPLANIGSKQELREELADLLSRLQS
jgi:hypothetical protein